MSTALLIELVKALDKAENDNTRIVVIRGSDGNFSAGADIKEMAVARASDNPAKAIYEMSQAVGQMIARFAKSPLTIITALEGAVMGGGFGLACASDIAIASHTVKFALPEAKLGLVPAQIAPVLIERIDYSQAKRLTLTAAKIDAEEAKRIGLVHEVTLDMDMALKHIIKDALACAPTAIAMSKRVLSDIRFAQSDTFVERAAHIFTQAVTSEEGIEGTKAFVEKRAAKWVPTDEQD